MVVWFVVLNDILVFILGVCMLFLFFFRFKGGGLFIVFFLWLGFKGRLNFIYGY